MLKNDRYIVGVSVPRLLPVTVSQDKILGLCSTQYLFLDPICLICVKPQIQAGGIDACGEHDHTFADVSKFTFKNMYTGGVFAEPTKTAGCTSTGL